MISDDVLFFFIVLHIWVATPHVKERSLTLDLADTSFERTVVYQTTNAIFYFEYEDLIAYCKQENNGEPNDFQYTQIQNYLQSYPNDTVFIPNTLGSKLVRDSNGVYGVNTDSLIRVTDNASPYFSVRDRMGWMLLDFAKKEKVQVFLNGQQRFIPQIQVVDVETDWYGETNIASMKDSVLFSKLRWIK